MKKKQPAPEPIHSLARQIGRQIAHEHPEVIQSILDDPTPLAVLPDLGLDQLVKNFIALHPGASQKQLADALMAAHGEALYANKELCQKLVVGSVFKEILRLVEEGEL